MSLSAAFTIEGTAVPAAVEVAYGDTVNLALTSTSGVDSVAFSIVGVSKTDLTIPTLTESGSPVGAAASFTMTADPNDVLGRAFLIKCRVTNTQNEYDERYGVVGVPGQAGLVPFCAGEEFARHASYGYIDELNAALNNRARITIDEQTGTSYTPVLTDEGKHIGFNNAAAIALSLPQDSDAAFRVGSGFSGYQAGAGQVTVSAGTGATVNVASSKNKTSAQNAHFTCLKEAANTWLVFGDLTA